MESDSVLPQGPHPRVVANRGARDVKGGTRQREREEGTIEEGVGRKNDEEETGVCSKRQDDASGII